MGKTNVRMLVIASVFTAMILLTVMFPFLRILNEYAHIGDGVIYLACVILPAPYAILAASAGAALADIFLGAMLPWAPMSLVIKGLMAYVMCRLAGGKQAGPWRIVLALLLASFINVAGYFLGSWLVYGLGAAAAGIPLNLIQSAVAAALYLALQKLVRRTAGKYVK